ncbi:hypothetical protein DEIPH_ctg052orf0034 [Deinococcus phoenicis]|uniref:Uncharacterized protein n=1 Tax=Deinococcus phoenicis TaxID=1476583 RepID=A0A016QLY7_9DEIO|nr:hypothetical protein [Deinococcus phoenicis]EYB67038.1 hypothetical protein DEIPH_ctg052orf0034 [Deinococcus phoenicis]
MPNTPDPTAPAAALCPTCQRPIDDPQTCQDCGKVTCTDCAVYSEDGDYVWCAACGRDALLSSAVHHLTLLREFVEASAHLDTVEAAVRRGPFRHDDLKEAIARRYLASQALEALNPADLTTLIDFLAPEVSRE